MFRLAHCSLYFPYSQERGRKILIPFFFFLFTATLAHLASLLTRSSPFPGSEVGVTNSAVTLQITAPTTGIAKNHRILFHLAFK